MPPLVKISVTRNSHVRWFRIGLPWKCSTTDSHPRRRHRSPTTTAMASAIVRDRSRAGRDVTAHCTQRLRVMQARHTSSASPAQRRSRRALDRAERRTDQAVGSIASRTACPVASSALERSDPSSGSPT
jgi:hypothetical protein